MLAGRLCDPTDPQLLEDRLDCRAKLKAFDHSDGMTDEEQRQRLALLKSVGSLHEDDPPLIEPPLACDYVRHGSV